MKRVYVFCFDPMSTLDIGKLFKFLNVSPDILNWRAPGLPGMVLLASKLELRPLNHVLVQHMGRYHKFLLAEINSTSVDGWLPGPVWEFILDPPEVPPLEPDPFSGGLLGPGIGGLLRPRKD